MIRILISADKLDDAGSQQLDLGLSQENVIKLKSPAKTERDIMHRKRKSPIAHQNLVHYYHALNQLLNSDVESTRAYAEMKLEEFDPVFRKYAPELFDMELKI